ncbi:dTDP-4-dehydrorhamnose reductase [Novosphingobium piscinae]|uniref:dTDP-4-dehydrorhamnose reductase n=1 Tax=Novosphingobium piscinae TaxID=1507448 RepID=A0A7X1FY24_9SPHN|nr:dTDP-4-dehydrorhamnose reductase [Novosphingobium piscinae]MBC2669048.1 dTDP-4-dehydrorhamnose reductase [Novosphingobium piscinae]
MRIAVTGNGGQVVRSLVERGMAAGHVVLPVGRPQLDLAAGDPDAVLRALDRAEPEAIVSAAAYTAVDKAESEPDLAHAVNATGAGHVARAAARLGVPLVHLSTDYVFAGDGTRAYREEDDTGPTGVYGASKLAGEQAVLSTWNNSAVLRTAWVYSPFGANFVKTMLRLAESRDELGVVADQWGNPTSALDIADGVLAVLDNLLGSTAPELRGVFHMTGTGATNWASFAAAIFAASAERGGPTARVKPITTADYPTPARRPANSRLDGGKLEQIHGVRLPEWQGATAAVVARLLTADS